MFEDFVKGAKYKMCQECKYWVEKTDGCDHLTCKCGNEFCYKCGVNYLDGSPNCECDEYYGEDID